MNYTPDVPMVRHRLLIVCLIRRKARTAGTYCPPGQNVHRLPRAWPNKLRKPKAMASVTITRARRLRAMVTLAAAYYL